MEILFAMEIMIQPSFTITSTSPDLQQVHRLEEGVRSLLRVFTQVCTFKSIPWAKRKSRLQGKALKAELAADSWSTHTAPQLWAIGTQGRQQWNADKTRCADFPEWDTVPGVGSSDSERSRLLPAVRAAARPLPGADHCQCCKCSFGLRADWHARVARRHCAALPQVRGSAARNELLAL